MKKTVFVINGRGGVGKDTLCDFAARYFKVRNVSTITPVKDLARQCGWQGEKTDAARKFLSDLKAVLVSYNDFPTKWGYGQYREFMDCDEEIMFLHIREGAEIRKFVNATNGHAKTLLVRRATAHQGAYGNVSDDLVEQYDYDYVYDNDLPIDRAEKDFIAFLTAIVEETKE